ncbi:transcriptional regulator, GntR family [Jannaschia sp. CCS1]|nr:transcriptional regulator, GntR family [Jannaschia sp. CCS1]
MISRARLCLRGGMDGKSEPHEPIRRPKLGEEVRDRLLAILDSGDLSPGDRFPSERELMARFDVGRPAVREAMQSLQGMGLIDVRHGERPRVSKPTLAGSLALVERSMRQALSLSEPELEDLKKVRLMAEGYMARLAARHRTDDHVADLRDILSRQEHAAGTEVETFTRLDGEFHNAIARSAGNPVMVYFIDAIFKWLKEFHIQSVHQPGLEALTIAEHQDILAAIEAQNGSAAHRAMNNHLSRANALYQSAHRQAADS